MASLCVHKIVYNDGNCNYFLKNQQIIFGSLGIWRECRYYRLLQSQAKNVVIDEMKQITAPMQGDKLEFIKNPVVAEFFGLAQNTKFSETELESAIITHLQKFIMELGKGYRHSVLQLHSQMLYAC